MNRHIQIQPAQVNFPKRISKKNNHILPPLQGHVVWLIPARHESDLYQEQINQLAATFDTPKFSPHITFGSQPGMPPQTLFETLQSVFANYSDLTIHTDSVRCSENPYQNLVHQCVYEPIMKQIYQETNKQMPGFQVKKEHHLSLLYGQISCSKLEEFIPELEEILPGRIPISGFEIISLDERVEQWETLYFQSI